MKIKHLLFLAAGMFILPAILFGQITLNKVCHIYISPDGSHVLYGHIIKTEGEDEMYSEVIRFNLYDCKTKTDNIIINNINLDPFTLSRIIWIDSNNVFIDQHHIYMIKSNSLYDPNIPDCGEVYFNGLNKIYGSLTGLAHDNKVSFVERDLTKNKNKQIADVVHNYFDSDSYPIVTLEWDKSIPEVYFEEYSDANYSVYRYDITNSSLTKIINNMQVNRGNAYKILFYNGMYCVHNYHKNVLTVKKDKNVQFHNVKESFIHKNNIIYQDETSIYVYNLTTEQNTKIAELPQGFNLFHVTANKLFLINSDKFLINAHRFDKNANAEIKIINY